MGKEKMAGGMPTAADIVQMVRNLNICLIFLLGKLAAIGFFITYKKRRKGKGRLKCKSKNF